MLISLLTYLLISNALSLRKDKSILFSRIVMVSLILTSILAFNNLFVMSLDKGVGMHDDLFHVTAFAQSFNIFIFLISPILGLLLNKFKNKIFMIYFMISSNPALIIITFNVIFSIGCLIYNLPILLEGYNLLTSNKNPMSISNILNPTSSNTSSQGGGGPSNDQLPIVRPQDNTSQSQDSQDSPNSYLSDTPLIYKKLGDTLEVRVKEILAEREAIVEANPINPSGVRARISEKIVLSEIRLDKEDYSIFKELVNKDTFANDYSSSVFKKHLSSTVIYSKGIKYGLIDLIKNLK